MVKPPTEVARRLRRDQTTAEAVLWRYLRDRQMHGRKWRRQEPIDQYVVDFICPELRLIIELDGEAHADRQQQDEARQAYLESRGFRVVRFLNDDVFQNLVGVMETLCELCAKPS
ncbi:MAG: DUF559 domain-containing protein [Armatimonadota bacterium]|nr:DUF559 domain-containing protein [Armatimonadota bacterium]